MNRPVFIDSVTATLDGEVISFTSEASMKGKLFVLWAAGAEGTVSARALPAVVEAPIRPEIVRYSAVRIVKLPADESEGVRYQRDDEGLQPTRQEEKQSWRFGFGKSFCKAVDSLDRKLQGRILQALADLANAPLAARGDTVKALAGDMSGFWRYRIGDFRLIYYPDEATHTVTLCDFASRGDIYD